MRKLYLLAFLCLAAIAGRAQTATQYVFDRSTGTVTDISGLPGTTSTTGISDDDLTQTGISIGFTFNYCGVDYTQLSACSNGFISLANSTATPFTNSTGNLASVGSGQGFLAPWWDDLDGFGRTAYFRTEGTAPTRVFIFQWGSNATPWSRLGGGRLLMFQVKLYESSNVVQYCYGNQSGTGTASVTIGIASSTSNYQTLPTLTSTTTTTGFTTTLNGMPAANTIMSWTPPPAIAVTPASMSFATSVSTSSASQNATLRAWGLTSGIVAVTAPANYQVFDGSSWVSSMNVAVSSAAVGTYINATVPVRFNAPGTPGPYNGNLDFTSAGATTRTITLSGTAQPVCASTPTPGTVSATATTGNCTPYSSNLSLSGATTGLGGLNYQWQTSPDGIAGYTDVPGATNPTYSATVGSSIYYRARVGCSNTGTSDFTPGQSFVYNAPPAAISASAAAVCIAGTSTMTNTTPGGTWSSSNNGVATIGSSSGVAMGVAQGTTTITYLVTATGCLATTVLTVNLSPSIPTVTPSATTICHGSAATVNASSTYPQVGTVSSGAISVSVPDANSTGTTAALNVSLPSGAVITGMSVNFNLTHTWVSDMSINLVAPNGNRLNLVNSQGGSGDNFVNTTFSSTSATSVVGASAPFTNTYAPQGATGVGSIAYPSNVTSFSGLYSVPNGTWLLSMRDQAGGDLGTLTSWSLTINYTIPANITWSPNTGLYTDAGMTTLYAGTPTSTIYASPAAAGTVSTVTTYTVTASGGGCDVLSSLTVTANPLPATIGGSLQVCEGLSTTLTNTDGGATWSSTNTGVATIGSASGVASGVAAGTSTISYTFNSTGCARTSVLTVNPLPAAIGGGVNVCVGSTSTLTDASAGGTWTSANSSVASVGLTDGVLTGNASGTTRVTYTLPTTCLISTVVTSNPVPTLTLTPTTAVQICPGESTSAFSASSTGGNLVLLNQDFNGTLGDWTVETTLPTADQWQIVPVGFDGTSGDGSSLLQAAPLNVGGSLVQTRLVSPSFSTVGFSNVTLTFNQYVIADAGETIAVEYSTNGGSSWLPLADYSTGGISGNTTWSASVPDATLALPVDATNQPDVRLRWYYVSSFYGWFLDNIKVSATMPAPTYSWTGGTELSCTTCANPTITPASVGMNTYTVTATGLGNCTASAIASVSVNPLPAVIGGTLEVCEGLTTTLTNVDAGGTWASANATVATIDGTTGVATGHVAGTAEITYTLPTGCIRTTILTVNPLPDAIGGTLQVCEGLTTTLTDATTGGTWTSSNTTVADIDLNTGLVSGYVAGTSTMTYTNSTTGCINTAILTVNPLPATIGGTLAVCEGLNTTLTNADAGGTWMSANTTTATIGSSSGVATGGTAGMVMITYTLPTGCITSSELTVNALPDAIAGTLQACEGLTSTLSDATSGGTWTSGSTSVATIDGAGVVTANAAGSSIITYTVTATGCIATAEFTVNPLPATIGGTQDVCEGLTTTLTSATSGGLWTSASTGTATVDAGTGVVTGVAAGNVDITYTIPTSCYRVANVTVNPLPATIGGATQVCEASTVTLTNADAGGTWASSDVAIATAGSSTGDVTGVLAGNVMVTYTLPTGCITTHNMTVNPLPVVYNVTGGGSYCFGGSGVVIGVSNTEAGTAYNLYRGGTLMGSLTGSGSAADFSSMTAAGTYTVLAVSPASCSRAMSGDATVVILPLVTPSVTLGSSPDDTVCAGTSTTFTATASNAGSTPTYSWEVNGGSVTTTGSAHTYTPADGDVITVTVTSSETCPSPASVSASQTMVVVSNETPVATIAAQMGTMVLTSADTICQGSMVTYTASALFGGTSPSYTWYRNGIATTAAGDTYIYAPAKGDRITAKLNSNYRCPVVNNVTSNEIAIKVDSVYIPVVNISINTGLTVKVGTPVTFTATVIEGGSKPTFQWYRNSTLINGATSNVFTTANITNNDSFSVVVYGTGDCSFYTYNSIRMRVANDIEELTAGSDIRMVPNPTSGEFVISGTFASTGNKDVSIEVIDMLGQVVYKGAAIAKMGQLNERVQLSNNLANGMYMLNVRTSEESKVFHFVLKQ
ncbi:MAG: proprotein convertase P-domain-containing protein [Taibaiella sp.]|nr:proprotein convertase P-domain-containing protein [Taibaiella sp.]